MELRTVGHLIAHKQFCHISPIDTVRFACVEMTRNNSRALPVMIGGHLVGIISEKDIIQKCIAIGSDPFTTEVNSIMTSHVHTIEKDEPISHAVKIMEKGKFHHVPVIDGNIKLIGVFSSDDISSEYKLLHETFYSQKDNQSSIIYPN